MYVYGADAWREFDSYPPESVRTQDSHLHPDAALAVTAPESAGTQRFRYDPADPTPDVGGAALDGKRAGRKEGRRESRSDVIVYTTALLESDYEIIGPVHADITLRTSPPSADLFVRLCDVAPDGRSTNVCDGYLRTNGGGPFTVTLWPTAYRFRTGHRIRVQLSDSSFPRLVRHTGTESPTTATTLTPIEYEIHSGTITLPAMPDPAAVEPR